MKTFNQLREGLWANIHAKRKRGERMRKKGEKGAPTADAMAKAKAGSKNGSTSQMEGKGTDAALQKKADASGISKSILKKVYDRGLAAWKVGHKPGTTPQQWAMARVNSFITKGKVWHKYDSDLRKQHQGK